MRLLPKKVLLSQDGFSLLEILIAGILMSGVILGILKAFTSAQSLAPPFITKSVQSNLGRERLEGFYESVRQDQWTSTNNTNALQTGTYTPTLSGHASTVVVSGVNPTGGDAAEDYRKVEITVT